MPDKLGDKVRVQHVLDAIFEIENYIKNADFEVFSNNSMMHNACIRQLGIIGEACNRISDDIKVANDNIKWRQIVALRNFVIHQYFGIDIHIIWEVVRIELPILKATMEKIIKEF